MVGVLNPFIEGAEHLGMGFHGSGVFCLYFPLMLLFQFQIFVKYVFCIFSLVGLWPQTFHISSYVAQPMFYPCYLITQVVHFITDQFQSSDILYQVVVDRDFGLGRCSGWSLEQILSLSSFPVFTLIPRVRPLQSKLLSGHWRLLWDLEGF